MAFCTTSMLPGDSRPVVQSLNPATFAAKHSQAAAVKGNTSMRLSLLAGKTHPQICWHVLLSSMLCRPFCVLVRTEGGLQVPPQGFN